MCDGGPETHFPLRPLVPGFIVRKAGFRDVDERARAHPAGRGGQSVSGLHFRICKPQGEAGLPEGSWALTLPPHS